MNRTRVCVRAALFSVVMAAGLVGCDLATSNSPGQGSDLKVVGGGDGTLPVPNGEPILSTDGAFELYYAADDYGDSACVSAWVRNTGPALDTWKITVDLDHPITSLTYSGAGDYLVFLSVRGELVVVPPYAVKFRQADVVTIRYCAAPVSVPIAVSVSSDGTAGGGDEPTPLSPVLESGAFKLYQTLSSDWGTGGCVQLALRNGGPAVTNWELYVTLDTPLAVLSSPWGAAIHSTGSEHQGQLDVFPTDASQVLGEGSAVTFGYCSEPLAYVAGISDLKYVVAPETTPDVPFPAGDVMAEGGKIMLSYTAPVQDGADWCYYVTFRNVTDATVKPKTLKVLMAAAVQGEVASTWSTPAFKSGPDEITYTWTDPAGMTPGTGYSDHLCMAGTAQKPRKLFVVY